LKAPLIAGRYFAEQDAGSELRPVIVSQSLAARYWPHESAVGKRVKRGLYDSERRWLTVVGVVGTLKETQDEVVTTPDAWYQFYAPAVGPDLDQMIFALRTRGDPAGLLPAVRQTIRGLDRDVPVHDVATMEQRFRHRTTTERFSASLYGMLGILGLVLAALGIYAVLAFSVTQRLRELGIRAALGARPADVRALILGNGLRLTAAGLVLGAAGSLALTRLLSSQLYQTDPRDPLVMIGALAGLAIVALYSCYIPAQRAAAADPVLALRSD
jgi:hypothetical protein